MAIGSLGSHIQFTEDLERCNVEQMDYLSLGCDTSHASLNGLHKAIKVGYRIFEIAHFYKTLDMVPHMLKEDYLEEQFHKKLPRKDFYHLGRKTRSIHGWDVRPR